MTEDPLTIEMNVVQYRPMLKLNQDDEKRSAVKRLLAEAQEKLALMTGLRTSPSAGRGTRCHRDGRMNVPDKYTANTGWSAPTKLGDRGA
jgi:hypothetical protein